MAKDRRDEDISHNSIFITIEGGDGSGKSTQIELMQKHIKDTWGDNFILTREPGGTRISESIREVILDPGTPEMKGRTEALLYAASRAQHVHESILPALQSGLNVICDRYVDSSIVYQGIGRGLGDDVRVINEFATCGLKPDLTILLDISYEEGIKRKKAQQSLDRLEMEKAEFHKAISQGFVDLAKNNLDRIVIIDASKSIKYVSQRIATEIDRVFLSRAKKSIRNKSK